MNNFFKESEMSNDPWKHRSEGMRCKTCIWFVPKQTNQPNGDLNPVFHIGRCRRHAPSMNGYPVVFGNDWCGDHRIDENKIGEQPVQLREKTT